MSQPDIEVVLAPRLQVMRVIIAALINGILVFTGIAVYMRHSGSMQDAPGGFVLTFLSIVFGGTLLVAQFIIPRLMESACRKRIARGTVRPTDANLPGDYGPLLGLFQSRLIVSAALLEGPAFFALIAYLLEGQLPSLIVAIVFLLGLVSKFPTMTGLQAWLEQQQELVLSERAG